MKRVALSSSEADVLAKHVVLWANANQLRPVDLSVRSGISVGTVRRALRSETGVSLDTYLRLSAAAGAPPDGFARIVQLVTKCPPSEAERVVSERFGR